MKARLPVRKAILLRRTYEAPAEGRSGKIRLDFNENTTGCGTAARKALARLSAKQIATYPEYDTPTRKLARYFGVRPEELLLTNGGDDALRVFFDTFVEPRSHILICEPTFPMYRYYAEIAGARVQLLALWREHGISLSAAALAALRRNLASSFSPIPTIPPARWWQQRCHSQTSARRNAHGCRSGRSLRGIFRRIRRSLDPPLSSSFCGRDFFESRRPGRFAPWAP